jgi:hypothetical protein
MLVLAGVALAAPPASAANDTGDLSFRVNGPVHVAPDETVTTVAVVRGDATVDGTVRKALVVVDGDAAVAGRVDGEVTVVNGSLALRDGATVHDVTLVNSRLERAPGATITGRVEHRAPSRWGFAARGLPLVFWLSMTLAVVLASLLYAAVGGRQLARVRDVIAKEPGRALLGAAAIWLGVPLLAVLALASVFGIPFGLGLLLLVLPAVWFLGYLASGAALGLAVLRSRRRGPLTAHPYGAAALGVALLQLLGLVPVLGVLVIGLAGVLGSGALAVLAARQVRGPTAPEGGALPAGSPA